MSFIRPEILEAAKRWRETIAGALAGLFGCYLALTGTLAAQLVGSAMVIGGGLLMVAGFQRARFRRSGIGPGVLTLDEGRLTYFGPHEGGVIAVADLTSVDLVIIEDRANWLLESAGSASLSVPLTAKGADVLFDVFGGLEGLNTAAMLRAVEDARPGRTLIWAKNVTHRPLSAH